MSLHSASEDINDAVSFMEILVRVKWPFLLPCSGECSQTSSVRRLVKLEKSEFTEDQYVGIISNFITNTLVFSCNYNKIYIRVFGNKLNIGNIKNALISTLRFCKSNNFKNAITPLIVTSLWYVSKFSNTEKLGMLEMYFKNNGNAVIAWHDNCCY